MRPSPLSPSDGQWEHHLPDRDEARALTGTLTSETLETLRDLGRIADARGVGAFVVGGVVRDAILERTCEDLDVVVEDDAIEFAEAAARELGGHVKRYDRFGTAILLLKHGVKVDVATSRSELYSRPGALPDVAPDPIEMDLRRRDFTLNAMAVRINRDGFGELLDPTAGREDLAAGVLRVIHKRSFEDDPTRVLRCIRFSARFSFTLDPLTEALLRSAVERDLVSTVSGERIMNEIRLILSEDEDWSPLNQLDSLGALASIHSNWRLPENGARLFSKLQTILENPLGSMGSATPWRARFLLAVSALPPCDTRALLDRLRSGTALRNIVDGLARFDVEARELLESESEIPRSDIHDALAAFHSETLAVVLASSGPVLSERITLYLSELDGVRPILSGADLVALGLEEGTVLGQTLADLQRARLDGIVTSEAEEREFVRKAIRDLDVENKR